MITAGDELREPSQLPDSLDDGRIRIRRYRKTDVPLLFAAADESVAELAPFMPWCQPGYAIENARGWVESRADAWAVGSEFSFVIEDVATERFVGGAGLNAIDGIHRTANLGYWVRTSETGRGIASAATRLTARFGILELRLHRLEILAATHNLASIRVAEKAGAAREGVLRDRLRLDDKSRDAVVFSITRRELPTDAPADC